MVQYELLGNFDSSCSCASRTSGVSPESADCPRGPVERIFSEVFQQARRHLGPCVRHHFPLLPMPRASRAPTVFFSLWRASPASIVAVADEKSSSPEAYVLARCFRFGRYSWMPASRISFCKSADSSLFVYLADFWLIPHLAWQWMISLHAGFSLCAAPARGSQIR